MATARVPIANTPEVALLNVINIDTTGQSQSPGIIIGDSDTIEFRNNAPFPVSIQFVCANGPVFNNISRIASNTTTAAQTPQKVQITTDYVITNLNTNLSQGPYSIEVGINTQTVPAPLLVPITGGNPPPGVSTVAVPQSGWIQFSLDQSYNVTWNPSTAFSGPANPVSGSPVYHAQTGNQNVNYTLVSTLPLHLAEAGTLDQDATYDNGVTPAAAGGGTVKIRS